MQRGVRGGCAPPRRAHNNHRKAHLNAPSGELHSDGGLGLETEFVASESAQQVGFADPGVTNEHHLEQVVVTARRRNAVNVQCVSRYMRRAHEA